MSDIYNLLICSAALLTDDPKCIIGFHQSLQRSTCGLYIPKPNSLYHRGDFRILESSLTYENLMKMTHSTLLRSG